MVLFVCDYLSVIYSTPPNQKKRTRSKRQKGGSGSNETHTRTNSHQRLLFVVIIMFRGLRKKGKDKGAAAAEDQSESSTGGGLPFVNVHGREEGLHAENALRNSLKESFKAPDSPVKRIADKLEMIPPALQSLSDAKGANNKAAAEVDLEYRVGAMQSAVDSFLERRRADLEKEEAQKHADATSVSLSS